MCHPVLQVSSEICLLFFKNYVKLISRKKSYWIEFFFRKINFQRIFNLIKNHFGLKKQKKIINFTKFLVKNLIFLKLIPGSPGSLPPPYYEQQLPLNPSVQPNAPPPPQPAAYSNSLDQNNGGKIQIISAPPSAPKNVPKPGM